MRITMASLTASLTLAWLLLLGLSGYTAGTKGAGWVMLAVLGVMPTALMRLWPRPTPATPEHRQQEPRQQNQVQQGA
jgi:hypothetical protein